MLGRTRTLTDVGLRHQVRKAPLGVLSAYESLLPGRKKRIRLLEIGVEYGYSLRMWSDYYRQAEIVGLDWKIRKHMDVGRASLVRGSQSDEIALAEAVAGGSFDVIIDDGSHRKSDQEASLRFLWPHLNPAGIYVVEDIHTSYRTNRDYGDTVQWLRTLVDDLHAPERRQEPVFPGLTRIVFARRVCVLVKA